MMFKTLNRKIKHALFGRDYTRMIAAAAIGDYETAAKLALMLGEEALWAQYHRQAWVQQAVRHSGAMRCNVYRRLALEHELKQRVN